MEVGTDINRAIDTLKAGQLVVIPTETVYGLAANALDDDAVLRIFVAKNRPSFNPLIIHVPSIGQAMRYVTDMPKPALQLAETFWPGPLTLLLPKLPIVPDLVTAGSERVAVRIPDHPMTRAVLAGLDFPLAAPSANPFGYISPTDARHVKEQLGEKVSYILDGGPATVGLESTIVGFDKNGTPVLHRQGGISQEAIEAIVGPLRLWTRSEQPASPGMLKSHYSPRTPLVLGEVEEWIHQYDPQKVGLLRFRETWSDVSESQQLILAPDGKLETAAKGLFAALHQLDAWEMDCIIAEKVPDTGLGRAINDRLERAQAIHK